MNLEQAILEKIRRLPSPQQEEVLRFAAGLQRRPIKSGASHDRSREMKWVRENRAAYANQWVAVQGDRLVAADEDGLKVFAAAQAEGIEVPFVVHILPEDPQPFVPGW